MGVFYKLITEPLRDGGENRPLSWRMGMRWSHLPNWFKQVPCVFGHWWNPWEPVKYVANGMERGCKACDAHQTDYKD